MKCRAAPSIIVAFALIFSALPLGGCTTTRFPDSPEEHRLFQVLEQAPHEYYFNVRNGVKSRVLGMLPEERARTALDEIRRRWSELDPIDSSSRIITYLNSNSLLEVAARITTTLEENVAPPGGIDVELEAAAVKQGLVDAVFEMQLEDRTEP